MKKTIGVVLALCVLAWGGMGCASRVLVTAPGDQVHLEVAPNEFTKIASVRGKDCVARVMGLTFNNPDLLAAEQNAMRAAKGSNLLLNKHVYVQKETVVPMFYGNVCFYAEGLAVKLK